MNDDQFYNRVGNDRISSRQIDELIGIARGLCADNLLNELEVKFLEKWLVANLAASEQPLMGALYQRIQEILSDGMVTDSERGELLAALQSLSNDDFELGEVLKATTLPLCDPPPQIIFPDRHFTFTGTFKFGKRKDCESLVSDLGATVGSLTRKTDYLVIGLYATESWKHSTFGNKILDACEMRSSGLPIAIVSEEHWAKFI
jgi:NAD-dependent DNA ligase